MVDGIGEIRSDTISYDLTRIRALTRGPFCVTLERSVLPFALQKLQTAAPRYFRGAKGDNHREHIRQCLVPFIPACHEIAP
jgi:hypothetical protein